MLAEAGGIPVEFHTHCNTGLGPLCVLEALQAGFEIINTATPPLANGSSNPSVFNVAENAAALGFTPMIDLEALKPVTEHFTRVAERFGSARTMLLCALASLAGCLLLPSIFDTWLIWPFVLVWGGVSFGIYTMSLIQLGERFTGQALIAGNAAFAFVWGIGGIVGSPATGLVMQLVGHQGLPSSLGVLCCVLAVLLVAKRRRA